MNAEEFRIGLLGVGAIAQVVHLPILNNMPGVRLVTICDADQPKAKAIAARFSVERVARHDEEIFAADDIDAIVIATPNHLHDEQAIAALQGGKHVLIEKPLAIQPAAAQRVIDVAEQTGRTLMVAMNNRYRPDTMALKPFAVNGELGPIFLARGAWLNRKMRVVRPTWRHRLATAGGGALIDLGVQTLDLAMWFLDWPRVSSLVCHTHPGEGMEVEDSAAIILRLQDGCAISLSLSWSLVADRDRHYMRLLGTRGSGCIQPLAVYKEVDHHGILDVTPLIPATSENIYTASYRLEMEDFVATARGEKPVHLPREQVELMRLVGLAYQSAREHREVEASGAGELGS